MPKYNYNYGNVEASVEVNLPFTTATGTTIFTYGQLTARYDFERINNGYILTGNLSQAFTSPWSGAVRVGTRAMLTSSTNVETSAGYLAVGQNGLDI